MDQLCQPGGACMNKINQGYDCSCFPGFFKAANWEKGLNECHEFDACDSLANPCKGEFELCQKEAGSFSCICKSGFQKLEGSNECEDVDECANNPQICGREFEKCSNHIGDYACECIAGYTRKSHGSDCTFIGLFYSVQIEMG